MTDKEKNFLKGWLFDEWNRSECDFLEKLYYLDKHHNNVALMDNLVHAFYKYRFYVTLYKDFSEVLDLSLFDDTTKYKNRSAELLNRINLDKYQDDLIYSFVLGIIHNNRLSNFDKDL